MRKVNMKDLSTPQIADACLSLKIEFRIAHSGIKPILPGIVLFGNVLPVRHYGSVDIILEVISHAKKGDVLVIDNGGRFDEACIGDLTALEARINNIPGIIVWGVHRDTRQLTTIKLPVFSYGTFPCGPRRLDERELDSLKTARFGDFLVSKNDFVFADDDGVVFIEKHTIEKVLNLAEKILEIETDYHFTVNLTSINI
ncbi:MAG: RraA family protein [Candidatus Kariarchaeaceae archaeon]|jgi:regulator of RNase E activity RraA